MAGVEIKDNNDFGLLFKSYQPALEFQTPIISANALVNYNVIIPLIEQSEGYIVACMESQGTANSILGMLIHYQQMNETLIFYKDASTSYFQKRGLACLGIRIAAKNDIWVLYQATIIDGGDIFIIKIVQDPFPISSFQNRTLIEQHNTSNIGEYNQIESKFSSFPEANTLFSSVVLNKIPNLYTYSNLLPYIKLWKNQSIAGNQTYYVSNLNVYQTRKPKILPQYIDCYLGVDCNFYYSIFTLSHMCKEDLPPGNRFAIIIQANGSLSSLNDKIVETQSTLIANLSLQAQFNIAHIGYYSISVQYMLSDTMDLTNKWQLAQDTFILNITNACSDLFQILENPQNITITHYLNKEIVYYDIPKLVLAPNQTEMQQNCFQQRLVVTEEYGWADPPSHFKMNRLDEFKVGIFANDLDLIGMEKFLYYIEIRANIENFSQQTTLNYELYLHIKEEIKPIFYPPELSSKTYQLHENSPPYLIIPLSSIEVTVGKQEILQLSNIIDREKDDYLVKIKSKQSKLFLEATNQQIIINPIEAVIGKHQVTIQIQDQNKYSLSSDYDFYIIVKPDVSSHYETLLKDQELQQIYNKTQEFQIIGYLEAQIKKITDTGQVIVLFSQDLNSDIKKYKFKVKQAISIQVEQYGQVQEQDFEVIDISQRELIIQAIFSDPKDISKYSVNLT
ncbi:UNKNOWN [Stylonychia lemnae]|uniref:Uncharacterized protein n=1 Tax=Stylonychia lemnae TaxID=5949 RepID=A0A078AG77_STYLE|nr:UNKNOWN [Stylonychia lemnae]|eukprot:CDW80836.1 UNKNOWN [Stylonychia lemnae]